MNVDRMCKRSASLLGPKNLLLDALEQILVLHYLYLRLFM